MQTLRKNSDFILSLGLIGIAVPIIVYFVRQQFNVYAEIIFVLGFLLLGLYIGLEYRRILNALRGRQVRYGGNAIMMTVLFVGIIALLIFLSQRYSKRIDLTASHSFSVSQQTVKVLDNLSTPVKVWAFYGPNSDQSQVAPLLKSYVAQSSGKVTYEFVDPDARPTVARQYGLAEGESGVLVLDTGAKQQKITGNTESDITSALVKVTADKEKVVYLLTGHGERSPDDTSGNGVAQVKTALEKDNYTVKTLNLVTGSAITNTVPLTATSGITSSAGVTVSGSLTGTKPLQFGSIPADASVIIINGPQVPLNDGEWQIVAKWLNEGGKVFLLQDALGGPTGLEPALLADWGLTVRNDLVIDPAGSVMNDPATLVITRGDFSPITKDMRAEALLPGTVPSMCPSRRRPAQPSRRLG